MTGASSQRERPRGELALRSLKEPSKGPLARRRSQQHNDRGCCSLAISRTLAIDGHTMEACGCARDGGQTSASMRGAPKHACSRHLWPRVAQAIAVGPGVVRVQHVLMDTGNPGTAAQRWRDRGALTDGCRRFDAAFESRVDE